MSHAASRARKRQVVCPACNAVIHFTMTKAALGVCPRCGEWVLPRGGLSRRLEAWDRNPGRAYEETEEWERLSGDSLES